MQGDSFWSQVLCAKYGALRGTLQSRLAQGASHLSRSISKGFDLSKEGVQWDGHWRPMWQLESSGNFSLASASFYGGVWEIQEEETKNGTKFGALKVPYDNLYHFCS